MRLLEIATEKIDSYETERLLVSITGFPKVRLFFDAKIKPEFLNWLTKINYTDKTVVTLTIDLSTNDEAYLNRIDTEIRYEGYGPELMKSALHKLSEMGYTHAKGYIEADNYPSQSMFKRCGGIEIPGSYNGKGSYYEINL